MNTKSRMMIIALLLTGVAYNSAGAAELCQGELKHAVPVNAANGSMVSISLEQGQRLGLGAQQLAGKQLEAKQRKSAERYQKPILIDKGACHYKLGSFKQTSIKM
ncbi:MAG: hypothetical protein JNJ51_09835 [Methylobacillus glycogenes]|nr:hypothetical protein [Methylobacillus glycogenes]